MFRKLYLQPTLPEKIADQQHQTPTQMIPLNSTIQQLKKTSGQACITISLPTHRTHPQNQQDAILLKNLVKEAEDKLVDRYGKREYPDTLKKLEKVDQNVDIQHNLDSLHIFLSEEVQEIITLPVAMNTSEVIVGDHFDVQYLQEFAESSKEYMILLLSQGGINLYDTLNEHIVREVRNDDFPISQNTHYITHSDKASDSKQVDNAVKEYFNHADKAVQRAANASGLKVVVVGTPRNYQHLMAVADRKETYLGNSPINYNDIARKTLGEQAWAVVQDS